MSRNQVHTAGILIFRVQPPFQQHVFEQLLAEWQIASNQPFTEVECPEFVRLLEYVHCRLKGLQIPSADTMQ